MADDLSAVISGTSYILAADDVGGKLHQRIKLTFGADGTATDVSDASGLPVSIIGGSAVGLTDTELRATPVPVSGTVGVSGTVPVSGTFWPTTQPVSATALPLPSGAATASNQSTANTTLAFMAPSEAPYAIVPHDTDPLPSVPKGIYVGTGGDVTLRGMGATADVTYRNLPSASYIAVRASHVRATGTTASDMIAEA